MRTVALVVAIALGIASAIGVRTYLKGQEQKFQRTHHVVKVAVAGTGIEQGEILTRDKVAWREKPGNMLQADDITEENLGEYLDRPLNRNIDRGTQIRAGHFIQREHERASMVVPEGMRAVSIGVDPTRGVSGLIRPGDRVDIVATMAVPGEGESLRGASVKTWRVLSNVTVLAVDDAMAPAALDYAGYPGRRSGYSTLTLAVSPVEAEVLIYLHEHAKLTFVLRSRLEVQAEPALPEVNLYNVKSLAEQADQNRQQRLRELEKLPPPTFE